MDETVKDLSELDEAQLDELQESISQRLKSIGAYQPLLYSTEDNAAIAQEFYCRGHQFYQNGKYLEAIDVFKVLTQIEFENVHYWAGLAGSYQMLKMYNDALLAYSTALILDPQDQKIFFHAANCCFALGHISDGIKALEMAEQLASKKPAQGAFLAQIEVLKKVWSDKVDSTVI